MKKLLMISYIFLCLALLATFFSKYYISSGIELKAKYSINGNYDIGKEVEENIYLGAQLNKLSFLLILLGSIGLITNGIKYKKKVSIILPIMLIFIYIILQFIVV
jgi:hypothetical protein